MGKRSFFMLWLPLCILIAGLSSAFYFRTTIESNNFLKIATVLDSELNLISADIKNNINAFDHGIRGLRGAIETVGFESFNYNKQLSYFKSRDYANEFPGARGFGLIKKVSQSNLAEFLKQASIDRGAPFNLKQLSSPLDPLFIIQYIEPQDQNEEAIGLDIGSEAVRRHAALASATSKTTQLTGPITLVQATDKAQHGFLFLHPIFETNPTQSSPELLGWAYAPLLINEILDSILADEQYLGIKISDTTATPHIEFYETTQEGTIYQDSFEATESVLMFGRQWDITIEPTDQFISTLNLPSADVESIKIVSITVMLVLLTLFLESLFTQRILKIRQRIAFASVVDNSSDGIIGVDQHYMITHWNEAADKVFDLNKTNAITKPLLDRLSSGIEIKNLINIFKKVSNGETVKNIQFHKSAEGSETIHYLSINISPIIARNQFTGATISFNDVTEIQELQQKLMHKNDELEKDSHLYTECIEEKTILESIIRSSGYPAVLACNSSGKIISASRKSSLMLNYELDDLVRIRNIVDILDFSFDGIESSDQNNFIEFANKLDIPLHSNITKKQNCLIIPKFDQPIHGSVEISAVVENETINGYIFYLNTLNLDKLNDAPLNIDSSLDGGDKVQGTISKSLTKISPRKIKNFTDNVYHEFKTPLTAINGYLELLDKTDKSKTQQEYIFEINQSISSLTLAIDEIIDLTFLGHGVLSLDHSEFELDELLNEVSSYLINLVNKNQIEIHFDIDTSVPYVLRSDRDKLKRILIHLGSNAVKYTEFGEVIIKISSLNDKSNERVDLQFSIIDTGIGIPASELKQIFDVFMQVDNSEARHYRGLGVGLTIAKQYVELLGGTLNATSEVGRGSEFTFTIAAQVASNPIKLNRMTELKVPIKALVVDDNSTSISILKSTLVQMGWIVTATSNSEKALDLIASAIENDDRFDLALIDWVMPGKDGWELGRAIKNTINNDDLPILIMATARSQETLVNRFEQDPDIFHGCLTKPITRTQIFDAYIDAIQTKTSPLIIETSPKRENKPLCNLRVLIVEDNPTNQLIVKALLNSQGASVAVVSGGKEALRALENSLLPFDIVLMDIHMPGLDGFETTARIHQNENISQLPVVPMTTNLKESDSHRCLAVGMTGHIEKPFNLSRMVEAILNVISAHNTPIVDGDNQESESLVSDGIDDQISLFCEKNEINIHNALKRFSGLMSVYDRALTLFITDLANYAIQLESVDLSKDDLLMIFHTLKGISGSLGFDTLTDLAGKQENYAEEWLTSDVKSKEKIDVINTFNTVLANAITLQTMLQRRITYDEPSENIDNSNEYFLEQFKILKQEITSFNMHAVDTFQIIAVQLKTISPETTEKMVSAINELKFKYAEELMLELEALIEGSGNGIR